MHKIILKTINTVLFILTFLKQWQSKPKMIDRGIQNNNLFKTLNSLKQKKCKSISKNKILKIKK